MADMASLLTALNSADNETRRRAELTLEHAEENTPVRRRRRARTPARALLRRNRS